MAVQADILRAARVLADLSQEQVGERLGLTRARISQYEKGAYIPRARALKLAIVLNLEGKLRHEFLKGSGS